MSETTENAIARLLWSLGAACVACAALLGIQAYVLDLPQSLTAPWLAHVGFALLVAWSLHEWSRRRARRRP